LLMIGRDREVLTFAQRDIPQSKSGSK